MLRVVQGVAGNNPFCPRGRPASADLAIQKARTAARLQRPTMEIENSLNGGRDIAETAAAVLTPLVRAE
jgi:uncharacterized protein GlcG (DUF336 family)